MFGITDRKKTSCIKEHIKVEHILMQLTWAGHIKNINQQMDSHSNCDNS